MNINAHMLAEQLPSIKQANLHSSPEDAMISYAMIYTTDVVKLFSECLYIADIKEIRQLPFSDTFHTVLFIGEPDGQYAVSDNCDYLFCDAALTKIVLLNQIQEFFTEYNRWEHTLYEILLKDGSISDMCNASVAIFKNPITVYGKKQEILGYGCNEQYKHMYQISDNMDFLDSDSMSMVTLDRNFSQTLERVGPCFYENTAHGLMSMMENVFIDQQFYATISIEFFYHCNESGYFYPLMRLTDFIRAHIRTHFHSQFSYLVNTKHNLAYALSGNASVFYNSYAVFIEKIGWSRHERYYCMVLTYNEAYDNYVHFQFECHYLEHSFPHVLAFEYEDHIVLLINMDKQEIPQEEFFENLVLFLREHILSSGMSFPFRDFFDFPAYYQQAKAILDYGLEFHPTQWHYRFSSFALPFILRYGIYSLPAITLIPRQVADILKYDQSHDSEYYVTLAAYLRNQLGITESVVYTSKYIEIPFKQAGAIYGGISFSKR